MVDYSNLNVLNSAKQITPSQQQMLFQERLSNTAHTREVADLKNAGLNPVLSAHTQGASTPSGASSDKDAAIDNPINALVNGINQIAGTSARSLSQANAELGKVIGKLIEKDEKVPIVSNNDNHFISDTNYGITHSAKENKSLGEKARQFIIDSIIEKAFPKATVNKKGKYEMSEVSKLVSKLPFGLGSWISGIAYDATQTTGRDFGNPLTAKNIIKPGQAKAKIANEIATWSNPITAVKKVVNAVKKFIK